MKQTRTAFGFAALLAGAASAYGCGSSVDSTGAGGTSASSTTASSSSKTSSSSGSGGTSTTSSSKASSTTATTGSTGPSQTVGAGGGTGGAGGDLSFTPCNPVIGCGGAFDCDVAGNDDFECLATDPSDADACGSCDENNGPYCKDGYTCLPSGGCSRYCCADADCGAGNSCNLTLYVDLGYLTTMHGVGVCVLGSAPDGGAGGASAASTTGTGGAGGGIDASLICDPSAPATSPSMGTCWTM